MSGPQAKTQAGPSSLATRVHGTCGPWLVLIHGWSCHQGLWDDLVPLLIPWARVMTLDLPGHGASALSGNDASIRHMARVLATSLKSLGTEAPILVGHSMGGPVALETAILLQGRCRLVIGVDTFTDAAFYARRPGGEIEARLQAFSVDFTGTMIAMVRRITCGGDVADMIAQDMAGVDPAIALAMLRSLLEWNIAARWPEVPCQVETINSAPLSLGADTVPDLQGLQVHLMEGVGHFPMCEDPATLAVTIGEIVRRSGAVARSASS